MIALKALKFWHFFSLDAPTIAVLWMYFASACFQVPVPRVVFFSLFLAVWILYTSDRLLDAVRPQSREKLGERHFFHHRHQIVLVCLILAASGVLGYLSAHLPYAMARFYLMLCVPVGVYFALVHAGLRDFPKELVIGLIFATATFIPLIHASPNPNLEMSYAFLFGIVCSINCLFIKTWEEGNKPFLAMSGAIFVFVATLKSFPIPAFSQAIFLSVFALLLLHLLRRRLAQETLRIYADIALLTPLLILARMHF